MIFSLSPKKYRFIKRNFTLIAFVILFLVISTAIIVGIDNQKNNFKPTSIIWNGADYNSQIRASYQSSGNVLLPNNSTDPTAPDYATNNTIILQDTTNATTNDVYNLFRIQGQIDYHPN